MFTWLNSYGANNVIQFSCTIKTKVFAAEASLGDIIDANKFYKQLYFKRYKGKWVLRF